MSRPKFAKEKTESRTPNTKSKLSIPLFLPSYLLFLRKRLGYSIPTQSKES